MSDRLEILFVGLGKMGQPMAKRLLAAGYSLAIADIVPTAFAAFDPATPHSEKPGELDGDIVVTMLPTDTHVWAALFAPGGALDRPRRVVIDMSSSAPAGSRRISAELADRGVAFIDAPVSGGVRGAASGTLSCMVGGPTETLETCRPILEALCKRIVHVGAVGSGATAKALNNFLAATSLWAASEALVVGAKSGIDPATLVEVWKASSGASDAVNVKFPASILPRTFDYGFSVGLMAKDVGIAAGVARDMDVSAPLMAQIASTWALARDALSFEHDMTAVIQLIERWASFEVPPVTPR